MFIELEKIEVKISMAELNKLYTEMLFYKSQSERLEKELAEARERIAELDAKITANNN